MQAGERIGGRYVLEERLGLGGMGEVWLAELEGAGAFRRRVVLKVLAPERRGDPGIAAMLADEARVVGALHHPGIVAALDYLETEEHGPVFVLEFVDGASLRSVLKISRREHAVMPEELAAHIGAQVAHALHAAHTALGRDGKPLSVVHRDVAPDNVLLSRSGAVYLGDFGVARAAGCEDVAHRGAGPKGKRGYMAPEQARGGKIGPSADIFSLGRVIAEAADVGCGPALREVIEKATAENPRDRFASASEMAAALLHACPPPSDPDRALAEWLEQYAHDALVQTRRSKSAVSRSEPPPAGRPSATGSRRVEARGPLFATVPAPRRRALKIAAACGALLFLLLPAFFFAAPRRAHRFLQTAISAGPAPAHGDIRISASPGEAEVYVDGGFRGRTPLLVEVPSGNHSLRVGSVSLGRWRAVDVAVRDGVEYRLDVDLSR
ncbi:MAG TPA: serine/threonine-protein kinase [Myxococcales bacterium]|nr:serine/threonine-protein kinase [Myxococcales bacterium]